MGAAPGESPRDAEGCRSMNGRCPASPGPLHPLPRLGLRYCTGAPGQGRYDAFGVRRPIGALNGWGRKVAVMAERPLVG